MHLFHSLEEGIPELKMRFILSGAEAERWAQSSRVREPAERAEVGRQRPRRFVPALCVNRTAGVLRLRSVPPSPARNSAANDIYRNPKVS